MKRYRHMFLPGIHGILSLLYPKLLTHCSTHDPVDTKEHPIQLGF